MTDTERPQFVQCLHVLSEAFKEPMSPLRVDGYWLGLSDLTLEQVKTACAHAIRGAQFFPRPVELREFVLGNPGDRAELGWLAWRQAARRIGAGASIVIEDAPLAETILAVFQSWPNACLAEFSEEMWAAKRKEFERVYHVMVTRGLVGIRYLVGTHELHNQQTQEWKKHTPVGRIMMNGDVKQLSGEQTEQYRLNTTPKELPQ